MVKIIINNHNICSLQGDIKVLSKLQKNYSIRHPNAFFAMKMAKGHWDGFINYITDSFNFKSGLLPMVYNELIGMGEKVKVVDNTHDWDITPVLPKKVGNLEFRGYQKEAVRSILYNKVGEHRYYKGVIDASTNAGKTLMMAAIHLSFGCKIPTIILLKDGDLFEQFKREFPLLLPKEKIGFIRGKQIEFGNVTIAMVQTLSPKVKLYQNHLAKFGIVLVDEADEGDSKSYKQIITHLHNTKVRVGLSGTIYMSKLAKDKVKNMNLRCFFSDVTFKITKREMADLGFSTPVVVRLYPGSDAHKMKGFFKDEYDLHVTNNIDRAIAGAELLKKRIRFKKLPAIVVFKFHEHGELLYKIYRELIPKKYSVELVHGDIKNRKEIFARFREGKIDILISSFIIKRGKNFPLIKYIQNVSATDSNSTVSQIMGRGERMHESKKKYYLDDFMDTGHYLGRHARHRRVYYSKEGFKVITINTKIPIENAKKKIEKKLNKESRLNKATKSHRH